MSGESSLEVSDVVMTELEVVDQVRSRTPVLGMSRCDIGSTRLLRGQQRITHRSHVGDEGFDCVDVVRIRTHRITLWSPIERTLNAR
jgi:hypothetical protein